ncbi:SpoIIIAH-like family protein [Paenibacillus sp. y28]|uniref:SpoIIIAH-like family protein n=1 Tax=Paenibacillus sp. y28 TaxID=3129110 RepID=UPI003015C374
MNNKRQTIWLVSMLSLMVVLSAYYLFTDDVKNFDIAQNGKSVTVNEIKLDSPGAPSGQTAAGTEQAGKATGAAGASQQAAGTQSTAKTDASSTSTGTGSGASGSAASKAGTASTGAAASSGSQGVSAKDAQVLKQLESAAKTGGDYIAQIQMKRSDEWDKKYENLYKLITDTKQAIDRDKAMTELQKLQDMQEKIDNLEGTLSQEFAQAVVSEEDGKWNVVVQAAKLEKSQAVSIVDQVMKEMGVGPEKIVVKYVN